jgi:chromosome segregation ATPase
MGFKIIGRGEEPESSSEAPELTTPTEVTRPEVKLETPFKKALNDEKENLTKRIGELEGELNDAKEKIKSGTEKKEGIAQEAEDIARRMKAIEAMSKIY